jgi:hypothetical protein
MRLWWLTPFRQRNMPKRGNPWEIVAASVFGPATRARPRRAFVRGRRTPEPTVTSERWLLSACYPNPLMPPPPNPKPVPVALDMWGEPIPPLDPSIQKVYLVDADMPFVGMVVLGIKWAFASIPAILLMGMFWDPVYWVVTQVLMDQSARR